MLFSAVDCPTMKLPEGAESKRTGDILTVMCSNGRRWTLRCENTEWIGNVDTCDQKPPEETPGVLKVLSNNWDSPYGMICNSCSQTDFCNGSSTGYRWYAPSPTPYGPDSFV